VKHVEGTVWAKAQGRIWAGQ